MKQTALKEIDRRLVIWNRMANDRFTMSVAGELVKEVIEKLKKEKNALEKSE